MNCEMVEIYVELGIKFWCSLFIWRDRDKFLFLGMLLLFVKSISLCNNIYWWWILWKVFGLRERILFCFWLWYFINEVFNWVVYFKIILIIFFGVDESWVVEWSIKRRFCNKILYRLWWFFWSWCMRNW